MGPLNSSPINYKLDTSSLAIFLFNTGRSINKSIVQACDWENV